MNKIHEQYIKEVVKKYENQDKNKPEELKFHSLLGLISDFGELVEADMNNDRTNILEELGDVYYFLFQGVDAYEINLDDIDLGYTPKTIKGLGDANIIIEIAKIADYHKKNYFYGKSVDAEDIKKTYARIYYNLLVMFKKFGFTEIEVINANAKKLHARFGDNYDNEKAKNRDKTAEMEAMKNG